MASQSDSKPAAALAKKPIMSPYTFASPNWAIMQSIKSRKQGSKRKRHERSDLRDTASSSTSGHNKSALKKKKWKTDAADSKTKATTAPILSPGSALFRAMEQSNRELGLVTSSALEVVKSSASVKIEKQNGRSKPDITLEHKAANGLVSLDKWFKNAIPPSQPLPALDNDVMDIPAEVITPVLAMDCEMVGVGVSAKEDALARCTVVNYEGITIFDKYVKVKERVTDLRTHVSGIRMEHMKSPFAITFKQCQDAVSRLLEGRVLVGHAINHDLEALLLSHPRMDTRNTATCKLLCPHRAVSLKNLAESRLGVRIQVGEHDSVEDSKAALALYKEVRFEWERSLKKSNKKQKNVARKLSKDKAIPNASGQSNAQSEATKQDRREVNKRRKQRERKGL